MPLPTLLQKPGLLDFSLALREKYESSTSAITRKERGQIFTPATVCRFMAARIRQFPERFHLLDAGAGLGSLAAAVCERLLAARSVRQIEVVLYESDLTLLPLLEATMKNCREAFELAGLEMKYRIHGTDFILDSQGRGEQRLLFEDNEATKNFDVVIMNPPYFKIGADSQQALAMGDTFRGLPNIYSLFMARAAELLRPDGELVAITPRSFCNGVYFRNFRRWFFARMDLIHIHSFKCRRSTFDDVLQESVITHTQRLGMATSFTTISTSLDREFADMSSELSLPTTKVIDNSTGDMTVRIPVSMAEATIIETVEAWPNRFDQLGLRISTGPVVLHRAARFLLSVSGDPDSAPLLGPHNVQPFQTVWPLSKRDKPLAFRVCSDSMKHLIPTRNYVLLRRFSAKEERRRLTASWFLQTNDPSAHLALENHINYIYHANRELVEDEVYGLTALFNSALLDGYFRIISGNTQVNATEIRSIRFPSLDQVTVIGARVGQLNSYQPVSVEQIVLDELGIGGDLADHLMKVAS